MKINKKILIFAFLIGLLTVTGLSFYINSMQSAQTNQVAYSKVLVAVNTIPANVKVTADMVTLKSIPTESILPEAITSLDKVVDKTSNSEIVKGEQILSSRIVIDTEKTTLAYKVPQNMRAMSMPVSEVSGVAGLINIGDKIDILATYDKKDINQVSTTYTQLQNIEVAAVGSVKSSTDDQQKSSKGTITVFVTPGQAEVLAYAISYGNLSCTLRNPVNSEKVNLNLYNSTNFSTYKER